MSNAETNAKDAASRVGINLDHAALITKIKSKLASEAGLDTLNSVDVSVEGSVVTLSGTVSTESQKQSAELAAAHVDGVTRVRNRLNVQP
jgi:osmotically-inducible protein OsmY